ncbi:MAG: hypothetical protein NTU44_01860 [Bacteroidetes bacterium]|nr:hypothetical protein [Bacteroidota bacterium]
MRKLSFLILVGLAVVTMSLTLSRPSPHGSDFKLNCMLCHNSTSWEVNQKTIIFNHNTTAFPLKGQHRETRCKQCHPTLVFSEAKTECSDCHTDFHNQSVRLNCSRCHTPDSWLVTNVTQIHRQSRFPLAGPHATANCFSCHKSGSLLNFEPLGVECYDCHKANYVSTTNPNHTTADFSTNCQECHKITAFDWGAGGFNHNFFPLTLGHANVECAKCHPNGSFHISKDCYSCHKPNYDATTSPNHAGCNFLTNCSQCHTTNPGWQPALYDHNTTPFPLTGAHTTVTCNKCHPNGCPGTPSTCLGCHLPNYNATTNPNHPNCNISQNCASCHTTNPGWQPATFDHSTTGYMLSGTHTTLTCNKCHPNGCSGTPVTCVGCHQNDYNQTSNPNHAAAQFPTDCATCHSQSSWTPATFNHDGLYFNIYSGKHQGHWNTCADCHPNTSDYSVFTCITCHTQSETNNSHDGVSGYSYNSDACYSCHQHVKEGITHPKKH